MCPSRPMGCPCKAAITNAIHTFASVTPWNPRSGGPEYRRGQQQSASHSDFQEARALRKSRILHQTGGRLSQPPRYHTALVRGPPAPPLNQPYIKLLCCMRAAIESFWLDSASTRSVPVDISGQSSICAAGHCPGKSAARPQMPSRSQLRQLTAAEFPLPPT